jgi:hypothetical protein
VKLLGYFDSFLANTVNLNQSRLDQLDNRVEAIVSTLENDTVLGPLIEDHVPQGSWAHRTIIKPLNDHEYDADFLLKLTEVPAWSEDPKQYLQQLRAAFKRSTTYQDMVRKKNRCCRIGYANDCHVDVVPYLIRPNGGQVIVNYADNDFEDTNPQGFTDWMKEKDDLANGQLRKVIRLLKYLRDYKQTFSVPSVILTTMVGERVQTWEAAERYSDTPTALAFLLYDLNNWLQLYPRMPILSDPSCPGTTFNHRWHQAQYDNFRTKIQLYASWITDAYNESDKIVSLPAWQKVFGDDFKQPTTTASESAVTKGASTALAVRAPHEEFIEEKGYELVGGYFARIKATVEPKAGFRHGDLRVLRTVGRGRSLRFVVHTDVAEPYQLFWKVRNNGSDAQSVGELRGQLVADSGRTRVRTESTKYRGRHYVECYVVKDGKVLATDHHSVVIT